MGDNSMDKWHHQERHSLKTDTDLTGDHATDSAFKFRDNRLGHAAHRAGEKLRGKDRYGNPLNTDPQTVAAYQQITQTQQGYGDGPGIVSHTDELEVMCGPLLNYKHMSNAGTQSPTWHGSVLIVTKPGQQEPTLTLKRVGAIRDRKDAHLSDLRGLSNGNFMQEEMDANGIDNKERTFQGTKLYADPVKQFWRFAINVPLYERETRWRYSVPRVRFVAKDTTRMAAESEFVVPAASQSFRIMFHSCNGFSVGTDEESYNGPILWKEVIRCHEQKPFHVMIGGGDQIYLDSVRVDGPLKQWTDIGNPVERRKYGFGEQMRRDCDDYYYQHYVDWYSQGHFAIANRSIPQVNIWDDHDIIDGFGSYTDHFMKCAVFRGLGGVAFKYYSLFQHHIPPPISSFTTDAPQTTSSTGPEGPGPDPKQLNDTFVHSEQPDSSFIVGNRPGPYVEERSRSIYMRFGPRIAFVGLDARTERTRHQVNYPDTYDTIFARLETEMSQSPGTIKHLIVLLGVPIAYPRLAWLEQIFQSPLIAPLRLLNKRFGIAGGFFNQFDGNVDLLDDLDDHYTARQHKHERRELLQRFQKLSQEHNIRVSILGGDVHLAACGRFYSNPKLNIPIDQDHRYMANIISSAITNKPPPKAVANLLARRNKIHHLDSDTDETLMPFFDKDPGEEQKTANANHVTMPARNFAIISENGSSSQAISGEYKDGTYHSPVQDIFNVPREGNKNDGHRPLHKGEEGAGSQHAAASGFHSGTLPGGLDVCIRVEIDQHDPEARTQGYGFSSKF
jgi:hypothetical protein